MTSPAAHDTALAIAEAEASADNLTLETNDKKEDNKRQLDEEKPQLSRTSILYDVGRKGYLTDAEKAVRALDVDNAGQLSNDKVASIMEQTLLLRRANKNLRFWVIALFVSVLVLGITNMFMAFAAAHRARNTDVDESTGLMTVRGSNNRPVVTVSQGTTDRWDLVWDADAGDYKFCSPLSHLARLWNSTLAGTPTNAEFEVTLNATDGTPVASSFGVSFQATGSLYNETHLCFQQAGCTTTTSCTTCIDFRDDFCDRQAQSTRRLGQEEEPKLSHHERRQLFQAAIHGNDRRRRQLFLNIPASGGSSGGGWGTGQNPGIV